MTSSRTSQPAGSELKAGAPPGRATRPIRARALVAIALLIPATVFFMVWGDWLIGGNGALESISGPAAGVLAVFTALNLGLKRWKPRWAFFPGELIAIYLTIALSAGLTGSVWGWGGTLAATTAYPIWLASPENQWAEMMWPNLPPGLMVTDREALAGFFLGGTRPYQREVLLAWLQPALWWTAWITLVVWVVLCFSVVIRRRWSEEEKLPFPMTIVPTHLASPRERLFGSTAWWIGVGVAGTLGLMDIVAVFVPAFPEIPTYLDISSFIANNKPWDAIRTTSLAWGPWEIGLSYLMPVDLAFSLIVFNLLWRAEYIFTRMQGWMIGPWGGFPYGNQQVIGAYVSLMASVVWLDRRYLIQVVRRAFGLRSHARDEGEAFSYRTAVLGGLAGLGALWWFFVRGGMRSVIAVPFLALMFIMVMAMLRMRAQLGPPSHWMFGTMPEFVLTQFPGLRAIGPRGLGLIAVLRPFMYEQDTHPGPLQLEALRMAERGVANPKAMAGVMIAAVPLTVLCYFWASLHIGYSHGLGAKVYPDMLEVCRQSANKLDWWLRTPGGPNWSGVESIGLGFGITTMLMYLKLRFPLWPLHPVAFPLAFSWTIDSMLPAVIVTWLVKVLLLRYGGLRAHRRALPFFIGLIAGSGTIGLVHTTVYRLVAAP